MGWHLLWVVAALRDAGVMPILFSHWHILAQGSPQRCEGLAVPQDPL